MALFLTAANVNFTATNGNAILKGADWYIEISIADKVEGEYVPFDLTGFEGLCQLRSDADSNEIIAEPIVSIIDPEGGSLALSLDSSISAAIPTAGKSYKERTKFQYDVFLENNGDKYRVLQGYVEVSPNITKEKV
jgi:hypothetical protein